MLSVLLVEDDIDLAATVVQYLELEGIQCDHASNGVSGLHFIANNHYDSLLLDINLPRLDGLAVCEQLRDNGDDTPVLMLTARDQLDDKIRGFQVGTDDYLVKPFELLEVYARVQSLWRRSRIGGGRASLNVASTSGAVTIDVNEGGSTIFSTALTIDQDEKTSTTAATAAVISDPDLADDAEITIDVDGAGASATGLKITFIGQRAV